MANSSHVILNKDMDKYKEISDFRRRAFEFISQAIQCEETGKNEKFAQSLYQIGIRELEKGLKKIDEEVGVGISCEETDEKITKIRTEMLAGLGKSEDRLEFLQAKNDEEYEEDDEMVVVVENDDRQSNPLFSPDDKGARPKLLNPTSNYSTHRTPSNDNQNMSETGDRSSRLPSFARPTRSWSLKTQSMENINYESTRHSTRNFRSAESQNSDPSSPTRYVSPLSSGNRQTYRKASYDERPVKNKKQEYATELETFLASTIVDDEDDANYKKITFQDVIGQDKAKEALEEIVILPTQRPELFSGLRTPAKGLLLFGPPGNGKTLLAKALASEAGSVLFNITASCLTSKFLGEGEKLVKTLFQMARERAPSIIFIDEVDSILTTRRENDHEASRRMKTEFFASFDGLTSSSEDKILVVGATNRPQELDDAALRRFTKRIYVRMPDLQARKMIIVKLLSDHDNPLSADDIEKIAVATIGYSGSDLTNLAREAAFGPLRKISSEDGYDIRTIPLDEIRPISLEDFESSLTKVRTSVDKETLGSFEKWNVHFGDVS